MSDKPKSTLPDGRRNPAWTAWYASTDEGKASRKRYRESPKGRKQDSKQYLKKIEVHPLGSTLCRECGLPCDLLEAIERGFSRANILCEFCAS